MKRRFKIFSAIILITIFSVQPAFAAGYITLYGTADSPSADIAILALRQGTDLNNIKTENIVYVNQAEAKKDGSFAITLPFSEEEEYIIRSNTEYDPHNAFEEKDTVYVSPVNGDDNNDGASKETALKTLAAAYEEIFRIGEIVLLDDTTYAEPHAHEGSLTIKGDTASVKLNMVKEISLNGDLTIDNLTVNGASSIYANGYSLEITETVTSAGINRLSVYGGKKYAAHMGNTNLTLLGGKYQKVYGGGYNGAVTGNTNVVFGGNANPGDGIDDNKSNISPCYVFGGGYNAPVSGKTNVTLNGNAVAKYLAGAGEGAGGTATDTNIFIDGGKVMNVYGGCTSYGGHANTTLTNCDTHITMTGGLAEALFGGSDVAAVTGNTYITLKGGNISRRVYTGCYNDWNGSFKSSHYVTGTTTLVIYPEAKLVTGSQLNRGIFSGSRIGSNQANEHNMLIYLNGSYNSVSSKIGEKGSIRVCNSHHDYTVIATRGGEVRGTSVPGRIKIIPDAGYAGKIDGQIYESFTVASGGTANVEFAPKFYINSLHASKGGESITGTADIRAENTENEVNPVLYITVFDAETNMLVACDIQPATTENKTFNINCKLEQGKRYVIKAMLWDGGLKPLAMYYRIELK